MSEDLHDLHLPHQLPSAYKTITAQCHCKSAHFTVSVPTSALPLPVHLCHCTICRYTHGTFCCFHAPLPKGVEPDFVEPSSIASSLTSYVHAHAKSERFFCSSCGCNIGDRDLQPDPETGKPEWRVATSIFTSHDEDTFQIRTHCYTDSALPPPNLSTWLPRINDRKIHIWNPGRNDPEYSSASPTGNLSPNDDDSVLHAQCHCAGTSFTIARPRPSEAADPFLSRFLRPNPSSSPPSSSPPSQTQQPPERLTHRIACICLCASCRLTSGAHATPWTFVPLKAIQPAVPEGFEGFGTLKSYKSSEKVTRAFCRVCGATVFYGVDDPERGVFVHNGSRGEGEGGKLTVEDGKRGVDVAVGILRAREGPAAGEWLAWRTGRVAGMGSGREYDGGFARGLEEGLADWGRERFGEVVKFDIPQGEGVWGKKA